MFKSQIRKGIRALTKHFGNKQWVRRIKLSSLDLADGCNCIAGQLFGEYEKMPPNDLPNPRSPDTAAQYGFHIPLVSAMGHVHAERWQILTDEWKGALRKLR